MKRLFSGVAAALVIGFAPGVHAALTDNGGNLVYDTDQNAGWFDSVPTLMTWNQAMAWASDQANGDATADVWSIPTTAGTRWGLTTGEEASRHFYDEMDGSAGGPPADTDHPTPPGYFGTGTEYTPSPDRAWWEFCIGEFRNENNKDRYRFYKEPHRHDVGATVPVPGAVLLFAPGLLSLGVVRRRFLLHVSG